MLGPKAPPTLGESAGFIERIHKRDGPYLSSTTKRTTLMTKTVAGTSVVQSLHACATIAAQLDFSATPRFPKGQLFPWAFPTIH